MPQVNNYPTDGGNDRVDVRLFCVPAHHDWWVHLSLPGLSFCLFAPLLLWKWIASVKWRNHALKKTCLYNTTEAYLFHLKGEVWGHPPVFPRWHFPTWHSVTFPVKYCWYSCRGIKSMSKRDTSTKALSLPLYLPRSLAPLCLFIPNTPFPSSSCGNTGLHALPTKCGWLASPGIRSLFNPKGLPKVLSPRIHKRQTQSVWVKKAYDAILSKNSKIKMQ